MRLTVTVFSFVISQALSWEALPSIPSGRRSQFFVLNENGEYKYGYDTGDGSAAKQSADASNEVSGHYFYKNAAGQDIDLKYTSGVQGFIPEGLEKLRAIADAGASVAPVAPSVPVVTQYSSLSSDDSSSGDDQAGTGDASYSFSVDTDNHKRTESSDSRGNVRGSYSYSNSAGVHDLSYIAGENTGFVATSGSLSKPNGLGEGQVAQTYSALPSSSSSSDSASGYSYPAPAANTINDVNTDGSYAFSYSTGDSSRQESADAGNNVQGRYSYQNNAGSHDLSYVAGSQTGFLITGGSLAKPNGLSGSQSVSAYSSLPVAVSPSSPVTSPAATPYSGPIASVSSSLPNPDGSYSFSYSAGDHDRQESSDASGNVQGRYSYRNQAGNHDLSYVAGSSSGFQVTGGSLSVPSGLADSSAPSPIVPISYNSVQPALPSPVLPVLPNSIPSSDSSEDDESNTGDSSYSFNIDTDEYKRQESSDASGNVQGSFSFKNAAGTHDLSFVAGSQTGFLPTGGNLATPEAAAKVASTPLIPAAPATNGVVIARTGSFEDSSDDEANTGDASYNFNIDTDEYKRHESSDASGNVQGSFSYKNAAGTHDLSYAAGSATGFVATGGSLSDPNAITAKIAALPYAAQASPVLSSSIDSAISLTKNGDGSDEQSSGDASYSFSIDTDEYKRHESSDSSGNVQGSYSYKNSVGNHDLSFVAGSASGFLPTGGSLKTPPGLTEPQLRSGAALSSRSSIVPPSIVSIASSGPVVQSYSVSPAIPALNSVIPSTKTSYRLGNVIVHSYLPPSNEKRKYGYILDTV